MADVSGARFRMRYSFESKLRAGRLAAAGMSLAEAAGREPLDGAPLVAPLLGRGRGRAARAVVAAAPLAAQAGGAGGGRDRGPAAGDGGRSGRARRCFGPAPSTVGKMLQRLGLSRPEREPKPAFARYERERAGELLHVDIKRLGRFWRPGKAMLAAERRTLSRGAGWQFLHVAVDDHSRLAYAELLPSERAEHAVAFLHRAARWYAGQGIEVEPVMTDNGAAYVSRRWRAACRELGLEHLRTHPYTPRTNGMAELLIGTMLRGWARAFAYRSSAHRAKALASWLRWYNRRRPHASLGGLPPASCVPHLRGQYT